MANWNEPNLTSLYSQVIDRFKQRDEDLAVAFNPNFSTATDIPVGAIRWNGTQKRWEIRSVSNTWEELTDRFSIDVETLDGESGAFYLNWNNFLNKPSTFPAAPHNHDDRYYTETEADSRFGGAMDTNGNALRLKARDGSVLTSLTVPYATSSGSANSVNGHIINQDLRTTDAVTFSSVTLTNDFQVQGNFRIGGLGSGDSILEFFDDNAGLWRSFSWNSTVNDFLIEDSNGTNRRLFHEGHLPSWSEIAGKPSTFTPEAHGHQFDNVNRIQLNRLTSGNFDTWVGLEGEIVVNRHTNRLHVFDGVTVGGHPVARLADIPENQDLTNYARKDQANTFGQLQTFQNGIQVTGSVLSSFLQATDTTAPDPNKILSQFRGNKDALQVRNHADGDYEIVNSKTRNGIQFFNGTGGVKLLYYGADRVNVGQNTVDVVNAILRVGNQPVWHSGNMGSGSGLNADTVDGLHGEDLLKTSDQGPGNGLDADTLDGLQAAQFATLADPNIFEDRITATDDIFVRAQGNTGNVSLWFQDELRNERMQLLWGRGTDEVHLRRRKVSGAIEGEIRIRPDELLFNNKRVLTVGDEGSGNGIDADTVDGLHASALLRATDPSITGGVTFDSGWSFASGNKAFNFYYNDVLMMSLNALTGNLNVRGSILENSIT